MSKVRTALALSDLHLGRDVGYLYSKDPDFEDPEFQKNADALLTLLQRFGPQDELILNGDFLELSLAGHAAVYRHVKKFFDVLAETGPYERIVFIPGNHDHHYWRSLGEQVTIRGRISQGTNPPGSAEYPFCFVDRRFSSRDPQLPCRIMLADLWSHSQPPEIVIKYPHHLLRVSLENGKEQCYLFTHGHFLEDLFKPVNYLIDPAHLEELEAFNNIWLEAFGYHLGHAGRLSERVRALVRGYEQGEKEARQKVKEILSEVYHNLKRKLNLRWPKTWLVRWGLNCLVEKIPLEKESGLFGVPIDEKLKGNIAAYLEKYIVQRYRQGKAEEYHLPRDADVPTPFTFVFGHTHRPIREKERADAKIVLQSKTYPLANTGGWLRTDGTGAGNGENAGVLVIDQTGARWETLEGKLR